MHIHACACACGAELYCGNGNFTIPLASNFRRVVATEVSKTSVEAAKFNAQVGCVGWRGGGGAARR